MAWRISLVQGSAPKMPMRRRAARVQPHALDLLGDRQHVAGRDHDDVGLEVLDQLDLLFGLAAAKGHHRQAQALGPVVRQPPVNRP
jgi:hypothetical protein